MELGLAAIVALILVKEAGVPIPVPGDLVVLGAGVAAARGDLPAGAVLAILAATVVGGTVQFALLRGRARRPLLRLLERVGVPTRVIDGAADRLRGRGAAAVAVARMTPGLRIATVPAVAIAGLRLPAVATGLAVGNGVFSGGHFAAGYLVGEPALAIVSKASGQLAIVAGAVVALAVFGAVGWWLIVRRRRAAEAGAAGPPGAVPRPAEGLPVVAWADAACPACLALALAGLPERVTG
jgi:membrane protein DedA with SNARE-associated domain